MKRFHKEPREDDRLDLEILQRALTTDLICLESLISTFNHSEKQQSDEVDPQSESFDNLDDDVPESEPSEPDDPISSSDPKDAVVLPEWRPLHLPSSFVQNQHHPFRKAELGLRVKQATRYLAALREAVAEKSFQYSHILRSAPTNAIRTRSRTVILRVSNRISHYSRVYSRARAAMVRLGADDRTLTTFQLLRRDDVKASTAILHPNIAGSSTLRLSWIWETGPRLSGSAPDTMRECKP